MGWCSDTWFLHPFQIIHDRSETEETRKGPTWEARKVRPKAASPVSTKLRVAALTACSVVTRNGASWNAVCSSRGHANACTCVQTAPRYPLLARSRPACQLPQCALAAGLMSQITSWTAQNANTK